MDWGGRFTILPIPTGGGKSAVYIGATLMCGWRTAILTSSKGLQDQLLDDFGDVGLVDVRGRQNFACVNEHPKFSSCESGFTGKCRSRTTEACPYYEQYQTALNSYMLTTNYDYWMAVHAHGKGLGAIDMLVADEAHNAPDHICQSAAVNLSERQIWTLLNADWPKGRLSDMGVWKRWATDLLPKAAKSHTELKSKMDAHPENITETHVKALSDWGNLVDNLQRLVGSNLYWGVKATKHGYYLEPLIAADYAEKYLWRGSQKILLTSATLNLKTVEMLGIPEEEYHYRHYISTFPVANCRLIHIPTCRVKHNWSGDDRQVWLDTIDAIISTRTDRKGIIHTKSYERALDILKHSKYSRLMITHESGATAEAVAKFKESTKPCILLSPSSGTGYDFPGDECRYQIIAKVPFVDTRDPILKAREEYDPEYGMYLMAQDLVQMASRGNRSATDWCENFIVDDLVSFAIFRHKKLFPQWFPRLYAKYETIPPPRPLVTIPNPTVRTRVSA
jgi:ATP-dependent DNA helicase DinG